MSFSFKAHSEPMHPGKPIIWPTLKSKKRVTEDTEERDQDQQEQQKSSQQQQQQSPQQDQASADAQIVSPEEVVQIASQLQSKNSENASATSSVQQEVQAQVVETLKASSIRPTPENVQLAALLETLNLPVSQQTFMQVALRMAESKTTHAREASALSIAANVETSKCTQTLQCLLDEQAHLPEILHKTVSHVHALAEHAAKAAEPSLSDAVSTFSQFASSLNASLREPNQFAGNQEKIVAESALLLSYLRGMLASGKVPASSKPIVARTVKGLESLKDHLLAAGIVGAVHQDEASSSPQKAFGYCQIPSAVQGSSGKAEVVHCLYEKDMVSKPRIILKTQAACLGEVVIQLSLGDDNQVSIAIHSLSKTVRSLAQNQRRLLEKRLSGKGVKIKGFQIGDQMTSLKSLVLHSYLNRFRGVSRVHHQT